MKKRCEECGEEFIPYVKRQRCCCRVCSDAYFANERRQAVALLRASRAEVEDAGATSDMNNREPMRVEDERREQP